MKIRARYQRFLMLILAILEGRGWRNRVQTSLSKKQHLMSKITRTKRVGGMAQVGERLPRKLKALSSNLSTVHPPQKKWGGLSRGERNISVWGEILP
jgi:hypothetical protein